MTAAPTPLNHRPTPRRHRRLVSIAGLVVVVAAGIALLARYAVFQRSPDRESAPPTIALHPCYLGEWLARCGTLSVAENPAAADGKRIALRVAVVKTASNDPKPDPLFWFAGWGSAGVTDDAASVISAFTRVLVDRDLVFIDQRGTGNSKVECRLPENQQPNAAHLARVTAAARRCADRVGPNLRYYTSAVAVDDFDNVRQALGYDKINIYGVSYGVTTGQIYLLRHGSHVRTAAFDAGSLLDVHIFERQPPAMQRALELLFARCAAEPPAARPTRASAASTSRSSGASPAARSPSRERGLASTTSASPASSTR